MGNDQLQSTLQLFRVKVAEKHAEDLGRLAQVPRYQQLGSIIQDQAARSCYLLLQETVQQLGRAMQLGQHRQLIDSLDAILGRNTLTAMVSVALIDSEVCAAFAVYLTTLEQAYHWPRDFHASTPDTLEDHKLVIQILNQPQLRLLLDEALALATPCEPNLIPVSKIAQAALILARSILDEIRLTLERGDLVPQELQDTVNSLHRTCRNDWNDQGDYRDHHSHREFGQLHEVMRASGTQRRLQELFEDSDGLLCFQVMPDLLQTLPNTASKLTDALIQLQFSVALIREELFSVSVDEVIWGRAFANFSKAVGFCNSSAAGGDAPIFWMLDCLCGQANPKFKVGLPEELHSRSRFFPANMRSLMSPIQESPSLRAYCTSSYAPQKLKQAFKALERQRFELYEMHRKKAARISVSLRAGQRGTSAGVNGCPYATPEKALATTLSSAVSKRFGDDNDNTMIDATAHAHTKMMDEDGNVYSARVRLDFTTPLALGPGDCLLVRVQDAAGVWHTRTYSVTYTYASRSTLENEAHQLAGSAEVYIRSKGLISALLCNLTSSCDVLVAVKPASHFRLMPNLKSEETTIFIAQGGALGIFVAWLESQVQLVGQYILVVATRQFKQLGFKDELARLADILKQYLRIVVVSSKPNESDIAILQRAGIETYCGRVTRYLDHQSFTAIKNAYICGTTSFGLDVAKSMSLTPNTIKSPQRLEPIITSRLPPIRLHVAPEDSSTKQAPEISRAELARHNSPTDLWIAVGCNVYDITALCKFHPGGEKVLMARAGRQADDIFDSVHGGSVDIESMLQNMIIGRLTPAKASQAISEHLLDKVVEIQNDLTNHSRFEKIPGERTENLAETPPTQVVYASVEILARDWCSLLEEHDLSKTLQCQTMRAWFRLRKQLDATQAAVYRNYFDDIDRCSLVLQQVFERLRNISGEIHKVLDAVKSRIANNISQDMAFDCEILDSCTRCIVRAINMRRRFEGTSCLSDSN